jgi:hypothetical protein
VLLQGRLGPGQARSLRQHRTGGRCGSPALDDEHEAVTCILTSDRRIRYADTRMPLQCNAIRRQSCAYRISRLPGATTAVTCSDGFRGPPECLPAAELRPERLMDAPCGLFRLVCHLSVPRSRWSHVIAGSRATDPDKLRPGAAAMTRSAQLRGTSRDPYPTALRTMWGPARVAGDAVLIAEGGRTAVAVLVASVADLARTIRAAQ